MNLLVRINLTLGIVFAAAGMAVGFTCSAMLQANARQEVLREAALMMDSARATRAYTSEEILPLLTAQLTTEFLPQSVPSYAATQDFLRLRAQHPEYAYKEATLNPTNPRDRAMDWEADIIQKFRNDAQTREIIGERDTPLGRSLYLAKPIRVQAQCLVCHSLPTAAPKTLLARYGSDNGFGWQPNEVVGAQVVSVPVARATANADRILRGIMTWVVVILAVALLSVNAMLYLFVVRPVRQIARVADELSVGNMSAGGFPTRISSELAALARSFERMRTSLEKALKLLEG